MRCIEAPIDQVCVRRGDVGIDNTGGGLDKCTADGNDGEIVRLTNKLHGLDSGAAKSNEIKGQTKSLSLHQESKTQNNYKFGSEDIRLQSEPRPGLVKTKDLNVKST